MCPKLSSSSRQADWQRESRQPGTQLFIPLNGRSTWLFHFCSSFFFYVLFSFFEKPRLSLCLCVEIKYTFYCCTKISINFVVSWSLFSVGARIIVVGLSSRRGPTNIGTLGGNWRATIGYNIGYLYNKETPKFVATLV